LEVKNTTLKDCFVIAPRIFEDKRGVFFETFNNKDFSKKIGMQVDFVQDNQSISSFGVLRGLHFQKGKDAQAKLVRVIVGKILDIVVDLRKDSETFGRSFSYILDSIKNEQLFVPRGFAHGFITLSERSIFSYKCDNFYNNASESGIIYNDTTLALDWKLSEDDIIVSDKDLLLPKLKDLVL